MKIKFRFNILLLLLIIKLFVGCKSQQQPIIAQGAQPILVASDYTFTEGPAADKNGDVFFTDQPNDQILKWSADENTVSVHMKPSGRSNGLYFSDDGNLLSCADEKNELWQIDENNNATVLVDGFRGKKLNGPNDLWVDNKGGIYLTDPFYKRPWWNHQEPQLKAKRVYYLAPGQNELRIVAEGFVQPNGIIGTPDGSILYIADIGDKKTYSYKIEKNGTLTNRKLFIEMGSDGMTLDNKGNVYITGDGVTVFNKKGAKIQEIPIDQKWTANVTFGGKNQKKLFITAMNSVYVLDMNVKGVRY